MVEKFHASDLTTKVTLLTHFHLTEVDFGTDVWKSLLMWWNDGSMWTKKDHSIRKINDYCLSTRDSTVGMDSGRDFLSRIPAMISAHLDVGSKGSPGKSAQWSNWHWGNAVPLVAWRSSSVKPNDSLTGRKALMRDRVVPLNIASSQIWPRRLLIVE